MRQNKHFLILLILFFGLALGRPLNAYSSTITGTVSLEAGGHPGTSDTTFMLMMNPSGFTGGCQAWNYVSAPSEYNPATGVYTLSGISAGDYYLKLDPNQGVNLVREWVTGVNIDSSQDCSQAALITVNENEDLLGYDFQLEPGGTIAGFMKDETGNIDIENAYAYVILKEGVDACSEYLSYRGIYSGNDGSYTLTGLPLDTPFFVKALNFYPINYIEEWYNTSTASTLDCSQATEITLPNQTPIDSVNFFLDPSSFIRGTVRDSGGNPLSNIEINLITINDPNEPCYGNHTDLGIARSDTDGTYVIQGIAPGTYMVSTSTDNTSYISEYWADPQSVRSCQEGGIITILNGGEDHTGKDFQLELGSTITGQITDSEGHVEGINVEAYTTVFNCGSSSYGSSTETNSTGHYTLSGIDIGEYRVVAYDYTGLYLREYWDNVHNHSLATPINITAPGQVIPNINIQLDIGSTIQGSITKHDGTDLSAEEISHLDVTAYSITNGDCNTEGYFDYYGSISSDGTYSIQGLPLGDFRVTIVSDGAVNYVPEWSVGTISVNPCDQLTGTIPITEFESVVSDINFQLDPGSTIHGIVSRDDSEAIAEGDFEVALVSDYTGTGDLCNNGRYFGASIVAADGSYSIAGIAPGSYGVSVTPNWSGPEIVSEWATGQSVTSSKDCEQAEIMSVTAVGQDFPNRNFQVDLGGKISGHIYENDGTTLFTGFAVVSFYSDCNIDTFETESFSWCGSYSSQPIVPGNYFIYLNPTNEQTSMGWLSQTGTLTNDCANARAVPVSKGQTTQDIDFILKPKGTLVPIYQLLLFN